MGSDSRFACGWLGGPKSCSQEYGSIGIPRAHEHLAIETAERDPWLICMKEWAARRDFSAAVGRSESDQHSTHFAASTVFLQPGIARPPHQA
jgi:truncated hemoglobin YjbI